MTRKRFSPKSRNALVVLGMHRSGTSALSGVLSRLGGDLPQTLMPANEYNAKGYYESLQLYQMNNAILASGGAQWDDWQPFNPDWFGSHRAEEFLSKGAEVLNDEFGASRLFILKDPRVCLVMPFWTRLFEQEKIQPTYVHIHRNPVAVATSLNTRDGLPMQYGLLLWLRHVLDAESGSRGASRCFTRYDMLLDNWGAVVANITKQTGLVFPRNSDAVDAEIDAFLSTDLNTSGKAGQRTKDHRLVSEWIEKIHGVLERWSEKGEDAKDFETFDTVRAEFDATAPLFGKLVGEARTASQHKDALETTMAELTNLREDTARESTELKASIRGYQQQAETFLARIQASEAATQAQVNETQALRRAHEKLRKKAARAKKENKKLLADLSTSSALIAELDEYRFVAERSQAALEEQRLNAERKQAEMEENATRSAQELEDLKQELTELDQEKWQIQSALAQRVSEADDLSKQNAENAVQATELGGQISQLQAQCAAHVAEQEQLRSKLDAQEQEHQRLAKTARLQSARLQADFEKTLETALVARRKQSDQKIEMLTKKEAQHRAQLEKVTADNEALRNSTSWKITKPLRNLVLLFRSR